MWKIFKHKDSSPVKSTGISTPEQAAKSIELSDESIAEIRRNYVSIGGEAGALVVAREVTVDECDWLKADIQPGALVYRFVLPTYGVCNLENGIPVSIERDTYPFFELPRDALLGEIDHPA